MLQAPRRKPLWTASWWMLEEGSVLREVQVNGGKPVERWRGFFKLYYHSTSYSTRERYKILPVILTASILPLKNSRFQEQRYRFVDSGMNKNLMWGVVETAAPRHIIPLGLSEQERRQHASLEHSRSDLPLSDDVIYGTFPHSMIHLT